MDESIRSEVIAIGSSLVLVALLFLVAIKFRKHIEATKRNNTEKFDD